MQLMTKKGYGFFEASSAFQKAIRRNDEKVALYFGVELFNSNYDEYAWKRMRIIVSEDVGLAEPNMPANIAGLYQMFIDQKKKKEDNRPERLFYIHAIQMLCRAKKSRLIDWTVIKIWREHEELMLQVPDYAHDMHTQKGKKMGRGLDNFYKEGTILENHVMQPGEEEMKEQARYWHDKVPGRLKFDINGKGD